MKKFIIISALAVLFPSSMSASEGKKYNGVYTVLGLTALVGIGYGIYHYTRSNPSEQIVPQANSSLKPQQKDEQTTNLSEQLNNPQPSNSEDEKIENNSSRNELNLEEPHVSTSKIIPPKPKPQTQPSENNNKPILSQPATNIDTQKQPSFLQELYHRFQENETENEAKRLLTDHAFSN